MALSPSTTKSADRQAVLAPLHRIFATIASDAKFGLNTGSKIAALTPPSPRASRRRRAARR